MKSVIAFLFVCVAVCLAMPQGKGGFEVKQDNGNTPTGNLYVSHTWQGDRGQATVHGNHQRELGGAGRHQTNVGASGSYDVFRSNDGKTTGTVFGDVNRQWNSGAGHTDSRTVGGRVEHTWGRK